VLTTGGGRAVVRLVIKKSNGTPLSEATARSALAAVPGVLAVDPADAEGDGTFGYRIQASSAHDPREGIFRAAVQNDFVLLDLHRERLSLEDTFRQLTVGQGGGHA
jgi:hypothetical protein